MRKWYVNFRNAKGHRSVIWNEALNLMEALDAAAQEYAQMQGIYRHQAVECITDAGLRD